MVWIFTFFFFRNRRNSEKLLAYCSSSAHVTVDATVMPGDQYPSICWMCIFKQYLQYLSYLSQMACRRGRGSRIQGLLLCPPAMQRMMGCCCVMTMARPLFVQSLGWGQGESSTPARVPSRTPPPPDAPRSYTWDREAEDALSAHAQSISVTVSPAASHVYHCSITSGSRMWWQGNREKMERKGW